MTSTAVSRSVLRLRDVGEQRITATLNDRISRAYLLDGAAREVAMDFNARLVSELRDRRIWPARGCPPQAGVVW